MVPFMFSPVSTYVALSIIFSVSMLISGILEIIFAFSNRKGVPSWGWYIVGGLKDTVVLAISKDLPFAHGRFCTTEGIENVIPLSD